METLESVLKHWGDDSVIDQTEPGKELLNIPKLHNKYLRILVDHRVKVKKIIFDYTRLRKAKEEYYSGAMTEDELKERGWEPFQLRIGTKSGVEKYVEADTELIKLLERKGYHEEVISVCESIMQELKSRTFQLRDFIAYERFIAGN